MFLFQAQKAFNIWHHIDPIINVKTKTFLKLKLFFLISLNSKYRKKGNKPRNPKNNLTAQNV